MTKVDSLKVFRFSFDSFLKLHYFSYFYPVTLYNVIYMTENTNYIFEELLRAAQPNRGLFVMPLPTGAGKTYNSCQMMAEELKK